MPPPISPKPAYGQVWDWDGSRLFLIAPTGEHGEWTVIRLSGFTPDLDPYTMYGLYTDRAPIIGYVFIDGDTK